MSADQPIFFDIKRYALHDGPNIRTTVFFKGCPLRCPWCRNPEGIRTGLEVVTIQDRCIGCRECIDGCPESALSLDDRIIVRNEDRCLLHLNCVEICPSLAQKAVGWKASIDRMMEEIEKDLPFFDEFDGGVTFSGGEPLIQADHLVELLRRCGEKEIHRTVDTSGYAAADTLLSVAEHTDLFLFDLKHMDPVRHREFTGVDNGPILRNLRILGEQGARVRIRIPLIGSVNDDRENIDATGRFLARLDAIQDVDLRVYHHLAGATYRKLDLNDVGGAFFSPSADAVVEIRNILEDYGLSVSLEQ